MAKPAIHINSNFNNNHPPLRPHIKNEPQTLTPSPPQQQQQQQQKSKPQQQFLIKGESQEPEFIKSIEELGNLSTAILTFKRRYDELQKHIDFIQNAIDTRFNQLPNQTTETDTKPEIAVVKPSRSEIEYLCEMMCSRGLRKYIVTNLSDTAKLREEAPAALKLASKPARLVLDCIGRFFLQGSKAYTTDSPMVPSRQASVLILEFFLRMMGESQAAIETEKEVKEEANKASVAWRKRLIIEGGVWQASEVDARGLLLFIACFGIPGVFRNKDVRDLIRLSNLGEIADAVRGSRVLVERIPDIIEGMMKIKMHVEAVDIAYTFGVEDKFPPQKMLNLFLRESKEAWKRTRANNSPISLKEANKKQLAALNSVMKCLEDRKLDPAKLLPEWQIKEKIISLEKEIDDINKKLEDKVILKRKADENESSNRLKSQELKRSRFTTKGSPLNSPLVRLQEQKAVSHADGKSSYDGLMPTNLLDGGFSGHLNRYPPASSVPYGSGAGSLPENVLSTIGGGAGVRAAGLGAGMSAGYSVLSTGSYAGVHGEMLVDKAGQMMNNNASLYGWRGVGDAAYNDRSVGQSFVGKPASMEGFAGLPNSPSVGIANRSSSSDLYGFADAVVEAESYNSNRSRKAGPLPPVVPAYHSSYRYKLDL